MPLISKIDDFHPLNQAELLEHAEDMKPVLHHSIVEPVGGFKLKERYSPEKEDMTLHRIYHLAMGKDENLCLDFGNHFVGYLTLELSYRGSHPDAPAFLKLKFAESFSELSENSINYDGWLSSGWIQEEYVHVDVLPARITLPRRYAFRYLKITMMDTSPKYKLVVRHAEVMAETSADYRKLPDVHFKEADLQKIYDVGIRTLANCMQDVFEDGPKRDRRLWVGDMRLQALTNYVSFRERNLVRRCLYLFAGSRFPDGRISACIFTEPQVAADDTWLFEYSLFFVIALEEYLCEFDDKQILNDLYSIAMQQIDLSLRMCDPVTHLLNEEASNSVFLDWNDGQDKQAAGLATLIYALHYAQMLARRKDDRARLNDLQEQETTLKEAALKAYWNEEKQCFVTSGQSGIATQVWMVLSDVLPPEKARALMERSSEFVDHFPMQTPYMHHYYVMALLHTGLRDEALEHIRAYWGSMVKAGADTFWEAWDPKHPAASPYGGLAVNSYCHAWSCTPAYILKKYYPELIAENS